MKKNGRSVPSGVLDSGGEPREVRFPFASVVERSDLGLFTVNAIILPRNCAYIVLTRARVDIVLLRCFPLRYCIRGFRKTKMR